MSSMGFRNKEWLLSSFFFIPYGMLVMCILHKCYIIHVSLTMKYTIWIIIECAMLWNIFNMYCVMHKRECNTFFSVRIFLILTSDLDDLTPLQSTFNLDLAQFHGSHFGFYRLFHSFHITFLFLRFPTFSA
jgi:hypothetical protein